MTPRIAIVGAGRMGAGIAQTFAYAGFPSTVIDLKPRPAEESGRVLAAAAAEVGAGLAALAEAGVLDTTAADQIGARVAYAGASGADAALAGAEFVFEAVPEVYEAKRSAFAEICARVPEQAIIASTTSSLAVDELAAAVSEPQRFLNAHWLNPAYLMPLVEVSPGSATSRAAVEALIARLRPAGKVPVEWVT